MPPDLTAPDSGGDRSGRRAAFLDRDGVINIDHGYVSDPAALEFTPSAAEGIRLLNQAGWLVIVVTNQSGVARGYYTTADVERFHAHMQAALGEHGAHVDAFYHCPYHPNGTVAEFAREHDDRKPAPGMIRRAMRVWNIDPRDSFLIGDKASDIAAAEAAGITGRRVVADICDLAGEVRAMIDRRTT